MSGLVLVLGSTARLSGFEVWDDGLMFSRYAENLATEGDLAWNPGGPPTWGLTSLGHLVWVESVRGIARPLGADALGWAVWASWLAGWLFVVLIVVSAHRPGYMTWTAVCLALGFGSWGAHFGTGMDTMIALLWLTLLLLLVRRWERVTDEAPRRAAGSLAAVAVMAGTTFFVRPDATIFPASVLAALVLLSPGRAARRRALAVSLGALAVGGLLWFAAWRTFGTALPLPFYVKSGGSHYGDAFAAEYAGVAGHELWLFVWAFWLPILAVLLDAVAAPKVWWRATTTAEKGVALATLGFVAYHLTQVAPIMGGAQRFYQPVLPALLWLSWGAVDRWRTRVAQSPSWRPVLAAVALAALLSCTWTAMLEGRRLMRTLEREPWPTLDLETAWYQRATRYWPALDVVAALPPEMEIAATEVGLPGVMNPRKVILDMAGLHDPAFALHGFSSDRLFHAEDETPRRPDVIYLPHPHYETMLRELLEDPRLRSEYRVWEARELNSVLGVAVLRGSAAEAPLAAALDEIAADETATAARSRS